jgi:hypothetical protein
MLPLAYGWPTSLVARWGAGLYDIDGLTKAAISQAAAGASLERNILIQGCKTGNCTFEELLPGRSHTTAGFCSKCIDTTSLITEEHDIGDSFSSPGSYRSTHLRSWTGLTVPTIPFDTVLNASSSLIRDDLLFSKIGLDGLDLQLWNSSAVIVDVLSLTLAGCELGKDGTRDTFKGLYPRLGRNASDASQGSYGGWNAVSSICTVYPCIKDLTAKIDNGRLEETVTGEVPIVDMNMTFDGRGVWPFPCFIDGKRYDEHNITLAPWTNNRSNYSAIPSEIPDQCVHSISPGVYRYLRGEYLPVLLNGTCRIATNQEDTVHYRSFPLCRDQNGLTGFYNNGNATFESVSTVMENIATTITDRYRLLSFTEFGTRDVTTVNGTVWQTTVCTQFSWPWLLFPATLIVLTMLSLGLIVSSTASGADRPPVWKTSVLPFLYVQQAPLASNLETYRVEDMQRAAKSVRVELKRDDDARWRLVRVDETAS